MRVCDITVCRDQLSQTAFNPRFRVALCQIFFFFYQVLTLNTKIHALRYRGTWFIIIRPFKVASELTLRHVSYESFIPFAFQCSVTSSIVEMKRSDSFQPRSHFSSSRQGSSVGSLSAAELPGWRSISNFIPLKSPVSSGCCFLFFFSPVLLNLNLILDVEGESFSVYFGYFLLLQTSIWLIYRSKNVR